MSLGRRTDPFVQKVQIGGRGPCHPHQCVTRHSAHGGYVTHGRDKRSPPEIVEPHHAEISMDAGHRKVGCQQQAASLLTQNSGVVADPHFAGGWPAEPSCEPPSDPLDGRELAASRPCAITQRVFGTRTRDVQCLASTAQHRPHHPTATNMAPLTPHGQRRPQSRPVELGCTSRLLHEPTTPTRPTKRRR